MPPWSRGRHAAKPSLCPASHSTARSSGRNGSCPGCPLSSSVSPRSIMARPPRAACDQFASHRPDAPYPVRRASQAGNDCRDRGPRSPGNQDYGVTASQAFRARNPTKPFANRIGPYPFKTRTRKPRCLCRGRGSPQRQTAALKMPLPQPRSKTRPLSCRERRRASINTGPAAAASWPKPALWRQARS